jgi:NADPH:quinone reductase-like Zn-dependent oxidoreductase
MRAYGFGRYGDSGVQEFLDLDEPAPMASELLVEVRAAGVNPVDWKIREGLLADDQPLEFPAVLGSEVSGVVRGIGPDIDGFAAGDEVFGAVAPGSGGYAEYALTSASVTAHKPVHVSFTDAATLPVAAATAYDGVHQLGLQPGQTLLINGASGGVGVAAAQLARNASLNVVGTASEDNRLLVESLGAIHVPYGDGVADRIRAILPQGVDAILDLAGGAGLRAVAPLLRDRGKLISAADPGTAAELGGHAIERDRSSRVLDLVAALVADQKLDPHVTDTLSLDEAAQALAAAEHGHARGKVVIQVS